MNASNRSSAVPYCSINLYPEEDTLIRILNGLITIFCVILGLIGNVYGLRATRRLRFSKALRVLLCALAVWDSAVLLCALGYYGLFALAQTFYTGPELYRPFWTYLSFVFHGPIETATVGSVWTTVAIAAARYLAVTKPFELQWRQTFRHAVITAVLISVSGMLFSIPKYLELTVEDCVEFRSGMSTVHMTLYLFSNTLYRLVYCTILHMVFISVGPLVLIAGCSLHTFFVIRRGNLNQANSLSQPRSRTTSAASALLNRRRSERKMGLMFTVLLGKFFLCYLLHTTLMLCLTAIGEHIFEYAFVRFLAYFGNFLTVLNSATNFLVYMPWNKKRPGTATASQGMSMRVQPKISTANMVTTGEARILLRSWQAACSSCHGPTLFLRALLFVSQEFPVASAPLREDPQLMHRVADSIFEFFDSLLWDLVDNPGADLPRDRMQNIGRIHRRHGVKLTNELLRGFKTFLLSDILHTRQSVVADDLRNREQTNELSMKIRLWNKFLSTLINEMKLGYMKAETDMR